MANVRDADTGGEAIRLNWRTVENHRLQELAMAAYFPDAQQVKLPEYPRVEVQGNYIYIVHENGKEELWGKENRKSTSLEAAWDIEPSLKAIKYGEGLLEDAQRLHGSGDTNRAPGQHNLPGIWGHQEAAEETVRGEIVSLGREKESTDSSDFISLA